VGYLIIQVSKQSIVPTFGLPINGEGWFKKKENPRDLCNQILIEDHQHMDWIQSIMNTWLKEERRNTLPVVHKYIYV
jgi:hypothetical protein